MTLWAKICRASALLYLLLNTLPVDGAVLNWNPLSWPSESLSRTYYASNSVSASGQFYYDPDYTPGKSVTIAITGNTSYIQDGSPDDTSDVTGGAGGSEQSLLLDMNQPNRNNSIVVTVTFNNYDAGVSDVNFQIFDIDKGGYIDQIRNLYGVSTNGLVAATVTGSLKNTVVGSGTTNVTVTGTASVDSGTGDGNADISFGSPINSFTFTYGNAPNTQWNPDRQYIGLYDISFQAVIPETGTGLAAIGCCAIALLAGCGNALRRLKCRIMGS